MQLLREPQYINLLPERGAPAYLLNEPCVKPCPVCGGAGKVAEMIHEFDPLELLRALMNGEEIDLPDPEIVDCPCCDGMRFIFKFCAQ